jgi:hypothetical protein
MPRSFRVVIADSRTRSEHLPHSTVANVELNRRLPASRFPLDVAGGTIGKGSEKVGALFSWWRNIVQLGSAWVRAAASFPRFSERARIFFLI